MSWSTSIGRSRVSSIRVPERRVDESVDHEAVRPRGGWVIADDCIDSLRVGNPDFTLPTEQELKILYRHVLAGEEAMDSP
jgi:hypothetical protein